MTKNKKTLRSVKLKKSERSGYKRAERKNKMGCYYIEMYNFPEDPEWKNKELYFTSIQKAVKYYKTFEMKYDCATIGEEITTLEGSRQKRTKRIYYERIIVEKGKTKIRDNRNLYKLKTLNKL